MSALVRGERETIWLARDFWNASCSPVNNHICFKKERLTFVERQRANIGRLAIFRNAMHLGGRQSLLRRRPPPARVSQDGMASIQGRLGWFLIFQISAAPERESEHEHEDEEEDEDDWGIISVPSGQASSSAR